MHKIGYQAETAVLLVVKDYVQVSSIPRPKGLGEATMSNDGGTNKGDIDLRAISPTEEPMPTRSAPVSRWPHLLSSALHRTDFELFYHEARSRSTPAFAGVDLTTLQRLNLYHLQRKLVVLVREITNAKESIYEVPIALMDSVHECLKCYFDALRDLKLVRESLKNPDLRDMVVKLTYLHSEQPGMIALLADAGLINLHDFQPSSSPPDLLEVPKNWDFHGTFQEDDRARKKRKSEEFSKRLFMAAFGGAALIAPMLIMSLHPTKTTDLVTTSAFVIVVAVLLAYVMTDATPKDIIGATAAYAAVLVVFVGSNAPPT